MNKFKLIMLAGTISAASVNAGQIQIGGTNGLTSSYITTGCAGANGPAYNGCATTGGNPIVGTATLERNYVSSLFSGVTVSTSVPDGASNAGVNRTPTLSDTNSNTGGSATSPVVFNLINDGANAALKDNNFWLVSGPATTTLTVPIGLYNVDSVWTMINDYWGIAGQSSVIIRFNFADSSDGTSGLTPVSVALTNGTNIRSSVDCTSGNGASTGNGSCPSVGTAGLISKSLTAGTTSPTAGVTVSASNLFTTAYTPTANAAAPYANTAGNVVLDDQQFQFASSVYLNKYLVSISIYDSGTAQQSRAALSAITADVVDAPEPGSIVLALSGLSILGVRAARRRFARS